MIVNNGIRIFINKDKEIEALFKYRYSEFKVLEVLVDGKVVGQDRITLEEEI